MSSLVLSLGLKMEHSCIGRPAFEGTCRDLGVMIRDGSGTEGFRKRNRIRGLPEGEEVTSSCDGSET